VIDIAASRLHAQRLLGAPLPSAADVVRHLGAVQAQDYAGAKWALGQRTAAATDADIDRLFDQGWILRTHVMRPTWHFVLPADIRWLLALTGPRILRGLAARHRQLGIDEREASRAMAAIRDALAGGRYLTRPELGETLRAVGIPPEGQRLPHLLMAAELDGAIVSGPRRGKQFTYALLAERARGARTLDRREALAELTRRYFRSHGPAQLQDFVWWSGLTVSDARAGVALAAADLQRCTVAGNEYWLGADAELERSVPPVAHLLPNWDEYTVGYRDRAAVVDAGLPFDATLFSFGSVLSNVVTIGGRARGAWQRRVTGTRTRVEARLLAPLTPAERAAVTRVGDRMSRFIGRPVELTGIDG
jgi:hypothetical protein